ncbi:MAG: MMPL family transporter [Desulfobacterales bacterium]
MKSKPIRYPLLLLTLVAASGLFLAALSRLDIDSDIAASLPDDGGAVTDAMAIFRHHPLQDQMAVDIGLRPPDPDLLVQIGHEVETAMEQSGLFSSVGLERMEEGFPALISHVVDHLPFLFSADELNRQVLPLLSPGAIDARIETLHRDLTGLQSIGQMRFIEQDPLGLRELKLFALSTLAPSQQARIYKGNLLSEDGGHLLVVARPKASGTDTANARRLTDLLGRTEVEIRDRHATAGRTVDMTPVGAYRAALDNETIVRTDVQYAVAFATIGIAVLLCLAFPRPLIGLLALLPALGGTAAALFVFSLFRSSISIMALGFGGAIISITVDHGIAYLLFLDRSRETSGREASREVWSVGLVAAATSCGAFAVLGISGFSIFEQLGAFTAMGIAFSFVFVHTLFPSIFGRIPPSTSHRRLAIGPAADRLAGFGTKGAWAAAIAAGILALFARPHFAVDLASMNTLSEETRVAEEHLASVWGNVFNRIYLMTEADSLEALQAKGDRLLTLIDASKASGELASGFVPSGLFPGPGKAKSNRLAWDAFWDDRRIGAFRENLETAAARRGFTPDAFSPFYRRLSPAGSDELPPAPTEALFEFLGISRSPDDARWRQFIGVIPASHYEGEPFFERFRSTARVFDPQLFSSTLGKLLFDLFVRMLLIIGGSVTFLLLCFFADWRLAAISLLPIAFSFTCTLGTLGLMGRPLDIPAVMLAIIVLGMGIDYSLFLVRSYQRYQDAHHPLFSRVRTAVFMAAASTLIGFGVLGASRHSLLQSAGISSFLGIGFAFIGAFLILPPLLVRRFESGKAERALRSKDADPVFWRYRNMEAYPRMFSRFKLRMDPMFRELDRILPADRQMGTFLDIGSGYGVPAAWLLSRFPRAKVYGIEPEADRVRVASLALGTDGEIVLGRAPDIPSAPTASDAAFMLDMCHFLNDEDFDLTLARLREKLKAGGWLVLRGVLKPRRRFPWAWWIEKARLKIRGIQAKYRSDEEIADRIRRTGYTVESIRPSGSNAELCWIVARR